MTHPFISSGRLISYLMLAGLVAYGLNYQITKTLLHLSALVALITWLRAGVLCFTKKNNLPVNIDLKDPRIILSTLLLLSASIVLVETSLSDTFMSDRFRKDFVTPAICFALILPVAAVDKRAFQLFHWAVPIAILTMAIPGIIDQYHDSHPDHRTSGNLNLQIIYGTNLAILVASNIAILSSKNNWEKLGFIVFSIFAIGIGSWAISMSGSRGPLLSIIIVSFIAVGWNGYRYLGITKTTIILLLIVTLFSLIVYNSSTFKRVQQGFNNYSSDTRNSSLGLRLEMWKGAKDLIIEHPISGVGVGQQNDHFKARNQEEQGYMHPEATDFIHLHNDVINAITWMGIPLGLLFMAFAVYPLIWALKARKEVVPQAMIAVSVIYLLNGLTNTPSIRATSLTLMLSVVFLLLQFSAYRSETPSSSSNAR